MNRNDYEKKYDRLRTLEAVRRRIVDRFNKKRKADNYEHDADTIAEYTDVIAPLYWQIREEWTGMPADFEQYDSAVYRMLRKELPDAEKAELLQVIKKAGEENDNV